MLKLTSGLSADSVRRAGRAGAIMRQEEERGQQLLHLHHGLAQMLQVHVCHFGGLGASDAVVMLHLNATRNVSALLFVSFSCEGTSDFGV